MRDIKTHDQTTAADNTSIGFDYQYFYFLYLILGLKTGEKIGLEVKDDIHIEHQDGFQSLLQLKHSVRTNVKGQIINLRESDTDIWKTIFNWTKIINDVNDNRDTEEKHLDFIKNTKFIIVTNKSSNDNNEFLGKFKTYKNGSLEINELTNFINEKHILECIKNNAGAKNNELVKYLKELLQQSDTWLKSFFDKLELMLDEDDLISRIKMRIKEKMIPEEQIESVFESLNSNLRVDNYIYVKKDKKIEYTFDDLYRKYRKCFILGRTNRPIINRSNITLPENIYDQEFVEQLEDIEIIASSDEDYQSFIIEKTILKLIAFTNLERWRQQGEIVTTDINRLKELARLEWKNIFDATHYNLTKKKRRGLNIDEEELIDSAVDCYYETLKVKLNIDEFELDSDFSNGKYYLMSEKLEVGWIYDWKERYAIENK
ncbi:hypothetical protein JSQ81_05660 [Sporosarcina sp. Marseille-Q4063]|uniref:hypothetical protein n=1 Tax=Sporosarcina sp. Marseille-Q4063 TaxID=2810514 RepID=UPI001BB0CB72|nr:hypothetical protein [Sporosarcina sp. Marseille-Q4063]QUW23056.1 hypothetical protein JSQ81_05660 [Sporosarcina sp. Marseille-Q4063]